MEELLEAGIRDSLSEWRYFKTRLLENLDTPLNDFYLAIKNYIFIT